MRYLCMYSRHGDTKNLDMWGRIFLSKGSRGVLCSARAELISNAGDNLRLATKNIKIS